MNTIKYTVLVSIMIFLSVSCSYADVFDELSSLDKDKYVHFAAGTLVSHASYPVFRKILKNSDSAWIYSFFTSVLFSTAKELYDADRTGFDWGDLSAGALGGLTVIVVKF
ncbi:MAG: hypothetical protein ABIH89_04510 [Elusimicrobiota bacterium]